MKIASLLRGSVIYVFANLYRDGANRFEKASKMQLPLDIATVKGFMPPNEGEALFSAAKKKSSFGPSLEIGSYCGKSAVYIGSACKAAGNVLFTIDHHRGSEETQPGWEYHDPDTWDVAADAMDTLPFLRDTLRRADLEQTVIPIVGQSQTIAKYWTTPLAFLFIDGGHSREEAHGDWHAWKDKLMPGGWLAIHDVFPDPKDGGRPPFEIYEMALASGFSDVSSEGSLRVLEFKE